jgi:predicted Zn-dependent protease
MNLTIEQALHRAVEAHKAGKIQDAHDLYSAILKIQPNHPEANHNLGVMAVSVNKGGVALQLFKTALEANPRQEQFWFSYIDALIKNKQSDLALSVLDLAKKQGLDGDRFRLFYSQLSNEPTVSELNEFENNEILAAIALRESGNYEESKRRLSLLLKTYPNNAKAWSLLSQINLLAKKEVEAEKALLIGLSIEPNLSTLHLNHARLLLKRNNLKEALI